MKRRTLSKRQHVNRLLPKCEFTVPKRMGPFTVVAARYQTNGGGVVEGHGIARKSHVDPENPVTGETIARHRAVRAILYKIRGRNPHHPLMG